MFVCLLVLLLPEAQLKMASPACAEFSCLFSSSFFSDDTDDVNDDDDPSWLW